ncbi:related to chromate transport protein [Phialocephala subalpina]|uniref:Related to chromate transport protein n=1 Tax=Phialocephala subalpina TaxID=576137 RepID=A0A1L7XVF1_9HELO|nr:related to chromate transport protein [Phialocephala subalpina]
MTDVYSSALRRSADLMHIDLSKIWDRAVDVVAANWYLGFTAFGGPLVYFQILHKKFVEKYEWVDEQLVLPGPASTKMLFCINYLRGSLLAGFGAFLLWYLPGAIGMYALLLGVSRIGDTLPPPVYALLSGLNAATVGIIALAAVQLAQKAITDKVTRALVFLGGVAGMLYTALWFFLVLMAGAGVVTIVWDFRRLEKAPDRDSALVRRCLGIEEPPTPSPTMMRGPYIFDMNLLTWKTGLCVIGAFLASFITIMVIRGLLKNPPRGVSLFANLYLAGTIIFGGGPIVIPLLREYIVAEGWVSPRDFLLGLSVLRSYRWLLSLLRGVNAGAIGLVFTAVYKLWQIGYVDVNNQGGSPLGRDPWWVAITAISFVGGTWFGLSALFAILLGGPMGMA